MSELGHSRRFTTARSRSALPPIATLARTSANGRKVPIAAVSNCSNVRQQSKTFGQPDRSIGTWPMPYDDDLRPLFPLEEDK